ncbi:uncharacterized protein [Centroberyx affinis]|uniref:uncharacterized protein n=1 Tax=Centroberyx affinis TaxID=166261 RepID=UPI003A5C0282
MAVHPSTNWNTGLCDCCEDCSTCCYAFWCCPCFACTTTGKFGECSCLPLLDMCSPAITAACGIPLCVPPAGLSLRVAIRHKYGIKGSLCDDIMISCFCEWCSWCQLARELKHRERGTQVINVQPQPVVINMQTAAPVMTSQVHVVNQQNKVMQAGPPLMAAAPGYGPEYGRSPPVYPTTMASAPSYGPPSSVGTTKY